MKLGLFAVLVLTAFTLSCGTPTDEKVVFSVGKGMKGAYVAFIVATPTTVQRGPNDNELVQQSLAYARKQLENKTYLFSGPIMDDHRLRGIVIVNTASEQHARAVLNEDPMVKTGKAAFELHQTVYPGTQQATD
jgi:uncharacterized protein YciI